MTRTIDIWIPCGLAAGFFISPRMYVSVPQEKKDRSTTED
jgi:hypothetical protein